MYIIIEGIDTAGKSTQIDILKQNYPDTIFTKEPGGTNLGIDIRNMVLNGYTKSNLAEMFLFLADRAEHIDKIIKQNSDKTVVSDRGFLSGIAYAKIDIKSAISLNLLALDNALPSKIIILTLSKEILEQRLSNKKHDLIESRGIEYLLDIQNRMLKAIELINQQNNKKIDTLIIDASQNIKIIANQIDNFIKN